MYWKLTLEKWMLAFSGVMWRGGAAGREDITGFTDRSWNMTCMSIKACLISLYTDPRKPRGTDNWKSNPFTITRLPTVIVPSNISLAAITMIVMLVIMSMAMVNSCEKHEERENAIVN